MAGSDRGSRTDRPGLPRPPEDDLRHRAPFEKHQHEDDGVAGQRRLDPSSDGVVSSRHGGIEEEPDEAEPDRADDRPEDRAAREAVGVRAIEDARKDTRR
jgi:hypothetical protein